MGEIKVDERDGCALKNALDDVVRKIFTDDLKYTEKKTYVVDLCVLTYFTLIPILILYTFMAFMKKNIILVCRQKEVSGLDPDSEWCIETTLKRVYLHHDYKVEMTRKDGTSKKKSHESFVKCVSSWVDVDGVVSVDKLKEDVLNSHQALLSGKKDQ